MGQQLASCAGSGRGRGADRSIERADTRALLRPGRREEIRPTRTGPPPDNPSPKSHAEAIAAVSRRGSARLARCQRDTGVLHFNAVRALTSKGAARVARPPRQLGGDAGGVLRLAASRSARFARLARRFATPAVRSISLGSLRSPRSALRSPPKRREMRHAFFALCTLVKSVWNSAGYWRRFEVAKFAH